MIRPWWRTVYLVNMCIFVQLQVLNISCTVGGRHGVVWTAPLRGRLQSHYVDVLSVVHGRLGDVVVTVIKSDFEHASYRVFTSFLLTHYFTFQGLFNALREVFRSAEVTGCFYHFTVAIYRQICSLGLRRAYAKHPTFGKWVLMVISLGKGF